MQNNRIYLAIAAILVLVIILFITNASDENLKKEKDEPAGGVVAFVDSIKTDKKEGESDYEISTIPLAVEETQLPTPPVLVREINFPDSISQEARVIFKEKISTTIQTLTDDPYNNVSAWIDLGLYRKAIEDYEGAAEAWEYAALRAPSDSIAFYNLGDLYAFYLHNNAQAEINLLKALENGSDQVYIYFKVVEFYRDIAKDTEKARAVAKDGVEKNPDSQELKDLLGSI